MAANEHHSHTHVPAASDIGRAFAFGTILNMAFVLVEGMFGFLTNSVALLSDAGHNFGDVLGLLMAWAASSLAQKAPFGRFTFGLKGTTIFAALANALLIILAAGALSWEALQRLAGSEEIASGTVILVSGIGVLVNLGSAMLFARGGHADLNQRGAFLHMAADAAVSLGVVLAATLIWFTGWLLLDPIASLAINVVIGVGSFRLLTQAASLSLAAVPESADMEGIARYLRDQDGVADIHDLHIWAISTTETALTCHLVMPGGHPGDAFLRSLAAGLQHDFGVAHPTFQIEISASGECPFAPANVV